MSGPSSHSFLVTLSKQDKYLSFEDLNKSSMCERPSLISFKGSMSASMTLLLIEAKVSKHISGVGLRILGLEEEEEERDPLDSDFGENSVLLVFNFFKGGVLEGLSSISMTLLKIHEKTRKREMK